MFCIGMIDPINIRIHHHSAFLVKQRWCMTGSIDRTITQLREALKRP